MGQGDDTTAQRLRLLQTEFLQPGSRVPGDGRSATRTTSPAPLHLGILDHLTASVTEVVDHVHAEVPDAGRYRGTIDGVYDWMRDHTEDLAPERQNVREALIYRQGLEHAIAAGNTKVIRPHRCPACRTLGLMWREQAGHAACTNRRCVDEHGLSRTWSLARLAQQHIADQKLRAVGTT